MIDGFSWEKRRGKVGQSGEQRGGEENQGVGVGEVVRHLLREARVQRLRRDGGRIRAARPFFLAASCSAAAPLAAVSASLRLIWLVRITDITAVPIDPATRWLDIDKGRAASNLVGTQRLHRRAQ